MEECQELRDLEVEVGEDLLGKKGLGSLEKDPLAEEVGVSHGCLLESPGRHNQRRWRLGGAHPSQVYEKVL